MKIRPIQKGLLKLALVSAGVLFISEIRAQTVDVPSVPDSITIETPVLNSVEMIYREPMLPYAQPLPDLGLNTMLNTEGIRIVPQNLLLESPFRSPYLHQSRNAIAGPFRYSYRNPVEGGDMVGLRAGYRVSDRFSLGGSAYMSSAYFGPLQPTRITNGSLQLNANYWVTDWLMLYEHGQSSANQGMNPAYMSTIGGANSYGGGVQVKITNKFGIGFGVTREYWMGKWQTNYQYYPVFY